MIIKRNNNDNERKIVNYSQQDMKRDFKVK